MGNNLSKRKRIFLIDTYAIFYRAHFAMIRNPLINSKGLHHQRFLALPIKY